MDDFSHVKLCVSLPSLLSSLSLLTSPSVYLSIAGMLNVHLGTDDENEGAQQAVNTRTVERTRTEEFRSYCDVRTKSWHRNRDLVAQRCTSSSFRLTQLEIGLTCSFSEPQSSTSSLVRTSLRLTTLSSSLSSSVSAFPVLRWRSSLLPSSFLPCSD
jgi:hypothetical protein